MVCFTVLLTYGAWSAEQMSNTVSAKTAVDEVTISDFTAIDSCSDATKDNWTEVWNATTFSCSFAHAGGLAVAVASRAKKHY